MKTHSRLTRFATILALGALGLLCQTAQATLLFEEGFNYTANSTLYGNGNWLYGSSDTGIAVGNGGFGYPGLAGVSGNGASVAVGNTTASWITAAGFAPQTGGSIYVSFVFDVTALVNGWNQNSTFLGLLPTGGSYASTTDPCDFVIKTASNGNTYGLGIRDGGGTTVYTATSLLQKNTANLMVMKYEFSTKTATLWINPVASTFGGGSDPATASDYLAKISCTGTTTPANVSEFYLRHAPYVSGTSPADPAPPYLLDDLRIGTTWADVTPVPEPSTFALIGLGTLGLALGRRALGK